MGDGSEYELQGFYGLQEMIEGLKMFTAFLETGLGMHASTELNLDP